MNENNKTVNPKKQLEMLKTAMNEQKNNAVQSVPKTQAPESRPVNNDGFEVFDIDAARTSKANTVSAKPAAPKILGSNGNTEAKTAQKPDALKKSATGSGNTQSPVSQINSIIKNSDTDAKKTPSGFNGREGVREPMTAVKPDMAK